MGKEHGRPDSVHEPGEGLERRYLTDSHYQWTEHCGLEHQFDGNRCYLAETDARVRGDQEH